MSTTVPGESSSGCDQPIGDGRCGRPCEIETRCLLHTSKCGDAALEERFEQELAALIDADRPIGALGHLVFPGRPTCLDLILRAADRGIAMPNARLEQTYLQIGPTDGQARRVVREPLFLDDALFEGHLTFANLDFRHRVSLQNLNAGGTLVFRNCSFAGGLEAECATIDGALAFWDCDFKGNQCLLYRLRTTREFDISGGDIGRVVLAFSTLGMGIRLLNAKLDQLVLTKSDLFGRTYIEPALSPGDTHARIGTSCFDAVTLEKDASVLIRRVDFGRSIFLDTDLGRWELSDVRWARKGRRSVLWDELDLRPDAGPSDFETVAETYRRLVLNYEAKRDHIAAEDFHVGEMEMRRRKAGASASGILRQIRSRANGFGVYDWLSRYGTSYRHAAWVLGGFLVVAAVALMIGGFRGIEHVSGSGLVVDYGLGAKAFASVWSLEGLRDFGNALVVAISMLTFQHSRYYEPTNAMVSRAVFQLAPMVLAGQGALLLLAVRRRFKR